MEKYIEILINKTKKLPYLLISPILLISLFLIYAQYRKDNKMNNARLSFGRYGHVLGQETMPLE